ncbi:MAG: hypothetical protein AB7G80_07255 [Dongiaceae bacterium]
MKEIKKPRLDAAHEEAVKGPWSVKGVSPAARNLARESAQNAGLNVGEWLSQVIKEFAQSSPAPGGAIGPLRAALKIPPAYEGKGDDFDYENELEKLGMRLNKLQSSASHPLKFKKIN